MKRTFAPMWKPHDRRIRKCTAHGDAKLGFEWILLSQYQQRCCSRHLAYSWRSASYSAAHWIGLVSPLCCCSWCWECWQDLKGWAGLHLALPTTITALHFASERLRFA